MSDGDLPPVDLGVTLDGYAAEATSLRMAVDLPRPDASSGALLDVLLDVRRKLDRVEELLGNALQLRALAKRRAVAVAHEVDDAWDSAAVRQRNAAVRDEFASAKERTAATNLEVLDLRRTQRIADRDASRCDEAVEFIRLRHRGLEGIRQDLMSIIRTRQWESAMER